MQITIEIPDRIAEQLTEAPERVRRYLLELLVVEAYGTESITHFQVEQILDLPSRWAVSSLNPTYESRQRMILAKVLLKKLGFWPKLATTNI